MIEHIINKTPHNGFVDKLGEVRLRIGIVDNPTTQRAPDQRLDPLDPIGAVNMDTGKICVRWIDQQGGLIRSSEFNGETQNKSFSPDDHGKMSRYSDVEYDNSDREMLTLTHPFIWANDKRWCGMNYLPPIGSVVIVGFKKQNLPVLLGYLQSQYEVCSPISLGEIMMKGYGQNYIWWKQSDEIEMKTWAIKDKVDLEDPETPKKNKMNSKVYLILNANDRKTIGELDDNHDRYVKIYSREWKEGVDKSTEAVFSASVVDIKVTDHLAQSSSSISVDPYSVVANTSQYIVNADTITLNGSSSVNLKGGIINLN